MHHLAGFYSSLAISASYAQVLALADSALSQNTSGQYIAWDNLKVIAAYAQGLTISRAQIQSPSLRNVAYPEIYPAVIGALTAIPTLNGYQIYQDDGPRLLSQEAFGIYASNSSGAAVSPTMCGLWLADRITPAPPGPRFTIVATVTITTIAQAWAAGVLTFETQLAAGEYSVVGMECIGDNSMFGRLIFPGGTNIRPGVIVQEAYGNKGWRDMFRMGRIGEFGRFMFNVPPQLEVLGTAAAATPFTVFLDVVKTR